MPEENVDVTVLLQRVHEGDTEARAQLIEVLYADLHERAARFMRSQRPDHTLQATALVSEAYVRLVGPRDEPWASRSHFLAVASKAMRQTLVDHARSKGREKRNAPGTRVSLDLLLVEFEERAYDMETLDQALTKLAEFDAPMARSVELRFFGGLDVTETSEELGLSVRSFERKWRATKAWLIAWMRKSNED